MRRSKDCIIRLGHNREEIPLSPVMIFDVPDLPNIHPQDIILQAPSGRSTYLSIDINAKNNKSNYKSAVDSNERAYRFDHFIHIIPLAWNLIPLSCC